MSKVTSVEDYIAGLEGWLKEAAQELDRIVMETVPSAGKAIKWGQPVYDSHGQLCYFKASKAHINFGFFRGSELGDPRGIIEGTGDKMRHVKIKGLKDIDQEALRELILAAEQLNLGK